MNKRRLVEQIVESVVNKLLINEGEDTYKATFDNAQELLDQGYKPEEVFDSVHDFKDGIALVVLNRKFNYINTKGKLLSKQWFDYAETFYNGFGIVELNGKYNSINTNGELTSDRWLEDIYPLNRDFVERFLSGELV